MLIIFGLEEEAIMNKTYIVAREMSKKEKKAWLETPSLVKVINAVKEEKVEVDQPGNLEAIVEGLLYIVGEDGAKVEQISLAIDKSIEDTKIILENIQRKLALLKKLS